MDPRGLAVDRVQLNWFGARVVHVVTADECVFGVPHLPVFSVSVKVSVCTPPRVIPRRHHAIGFDLTQAPDDVANRDCVPGPGSTSRRPWPGPVRS